MKHYRNLLDATCPICRAYPCMCERLKEAGYVKLVEDQRLPEWALNGIGSETEKAIYRVAQQDMLEAGWRKVE